MQNRGMRTKSGILAVALFFAVLPAHAKRRPASAIAESEYLRAARETAAWLMSIERRFPNDGIAWPLSSYAPESFSTGMVTGAAGTGTFFLELYATTRDARYLERARGAANYIVTAYGANGSGIGNLSHEWLGGVAGSGGYLLEVFRVTGEQKYLDAARAGGDWLIANAVSENGGVYWKHRGVTNTYTGVAHGAAGSGIFLLDLYELTHDAKYLDTAKKAWTWIAQYTLPVGEDGIGFKRLTHDTVPYIGWCGGASGILFFLDKLADASGDPQHALALARAANGLVNGALPRGDGAAWDHYGPNTGNGVIYCHGATSVMGGLSNAYSMTNDARLLDMARKAERWVATQAVAQDGGTSWPTFARSNSRLTGYLIGAASVGHAYLRLWSVDPSTSHLEQARAAARFLLSIADRPAPGQLRFINYTHETGANDDPKGYETGWYAGASGIGLFLLELDRATRGITLPAEFSGAHP
jgi:lantibiotic modifying enzyme